MAFGRSNSLSINTGAGSTLFGQQATQPQAQPSLFGNASSNAAGTGLFGNATPTATGQTPSLFGNTAAQPATQAPSLFGNTAPTQTSSQSTSLFGNLNTSAQASAPKTSLFGNATATAQPQPSSLFGNTTNAQASTQQGSLFGNASGGLFGKSPTTAQPSLFGTQTGGLFGKPATPAASSSLFGNSSQAPGIAQNAGSSAFGMTAIPRDQLGQASLLNASQFRQTQAAPFAGRLTMGQNGGSTTNNATVGAVRVSLDDMRPTTRFQDLIDPLKEEFERADKMIQAQEAFCRQIEAMKTVHGQNIQSLAPDVATITDKADAVEHVLSSDAQMIHRHARTVEKDQQDFERCRRVAENLAFPSSYHLSNTSSLSYGNLAAGQQRLAQTTDGNEPNASTYDVDLVGGYFIPLARELQQTINTYVSNLSEIESHMKVIEDAAVTQAQQLAPRRSGSASRTTDADVIRDLSDTLRDFEQSILGVASSVGQCREGVTELTMGRGAGQYRYSRT